MNTIKNYLKHLNLGCDAMFQRPKNANWLKFKPGEAVWYCNTAVGDSLLGNMLRNMSENAGIQPRLTNHCIEPGIRATSVTVLSDTCIETRHIKSVTGYIDKSDQAVENYNNRPSLKQLQERLSAILSSLIWPMLLKFNWIKTMLFKTSSK